MSSYFQTRASRRSKLIAFCELESEWQRRGKVAILRKPVTALWLGLSALIFIAVRIRAKPRRRSQPWHCERAHSTEFTNLELVEDAALTYEYAVYVTNLERDASQLRGLSEITKTATTN